LKRFEEKEVEFPHFVDSICGGREGQQKSVATSGFIGRQPCIKFQLTATLALPSLNSQLQRVLDK
jgi:hypothetical protein